MTGPRISDLRHRVVIERVSLLDDGGGGVVETWLPVASVWASIKPLSGNERAEADAISGNLTHEVFVRHREDVGPNMRLSMDGRVFDLLVVMEHEGRQKFLRCFAQEQGL